MKTVSISIWLCVCILLTNTPAQDIRHLEKNLENAEAGLLRVQREYDSLNTIYLSKIREIENEKKKKPSDEAKVTALMSASVSLSNTLTALQSRERQLEKQLPGMKKNLVRKYSGIIDSLTLLQQGSGSRGVQRELNDQILLYMAKRLKAGPEAAAFSFDVKKITEMDLAAVTDPVRKELYIDYLKNAVGEVERLMSDVSETSLQIQQLAKLQKRAAGFLDEQDFSGNSESRKPLPSPATQTEYGAALSADVRSNLSRTMVSYAAVLSQVSFRQGAGIESRRDIAAGISGKSVPVREYQAILKELKSRLADFRDLLKSKYER